jgi:hypothetical protein
MENFDFTPIFEAIITIVSLVLTGIVIPYIKQRIGKEKTENLKKWVSVGVKAAEQIYGSKTGQTKKEYVVSFLLSKGIVFDVDEVEALIESEVYKLTNKEIE